MKIWRVILVLFYLIVSQISCIHIRKKIVTTEKFHKTGETIEINNLIKQLENEHQQFYKEEITESDYMEWPLLDNKDLSKYCAEYIEHIIPSRKIVGAFGIKMRGSLHYEKINTNIINNIVIIQCRTWYKKCKRFYCMTRAHEPNCVYALKSLENWINHKFIIIHKHCNFEDKPLMNKSVKRRRDDHIDRIIETTGQPISKDKYLLEYEFQHQEMLKKTMEEGEGFQWSYAMVHPNLNLYCYQYMRKCCPERNRKGVRGNWNILKLRYQKLITEKDIDVTTVSCLLPYTSQRRYYHIIRAPQANCVYAVRRMGRQLYDTFVIIFKQCDFEDLPINQPTILDKDMIPKTEIKEEKFETFNFFYKVN